MSTAVVIRDPKAYVTPDVWEREVALLLRNPENTRDLAEAKFGQAIAYLVTCGENPDLLKGPSEQVDEAWHSFMLDSIPYHHFTSRHFGRYIHHVPVLPGAAAGVLCVTDDEVTQDEHDPKTAARSSWSRRSRPSRRPGSRSTPTCGAWRTRPTATSATPGATTRPSSSE